MKNRRERSTSQATPPSQRIPSAKWIEASSSDFDEHRIARIDELRQQREIEDDDLGIQQVCQEAFA